MARSDVHAPKALITENYEYLFAADTRGPWALGLDPNFLAELHNYDTLEGAERGTSQCHHCGAHLRYVAWLRYIPTGRTIVVGETCLDNRFALATADFHKLRKAAELDRQRQRIVTARNAFVEANPDLAFLNDEAVFETLPPHIRENYFIADIGRKLRLYGDLSENQVNAVRKAIVRENEKVERLAAEKVNEVPVPASVLHQRVVVSGTIVAERSEEGQYGWTHKILLKVAEGDGFWKLWVTKPASLLGEAGKGDIVRLKVTIRPSDRDPSFAFGKRPVEVKS